MPEYLVTAATPEPAAAGLATLDVAAPAARVFECEFVVAQAAEVTVLRVVDAQALPGGGTRVTGRVVDVPTSPQRRPPAEGEARFGVMPASHPVAEEALLRARAHLREHWDARYATPGRVPLDDVDPAYRAWLTQLGAIAAPVLVLGDGEGRHARAVPAAHPVTMVELSPVGAATCRDLARRPIDIVVGDVFRWLLDADLTPWRALVLTYLGPFADAELDLLTTTLATHTRRGGAVWLEFARAGLPIAHEHRLTEATGTPPLRFRRPGDDVERIRFSRADALSRAALADCYPPGYLDELRADWPE